MSIWIPRSFGIWSTTITSPIPDLKPVSTGSEMKFATKPSLSAEASTSIAPTTIASVADAATRSAAAALGAASPRAAADKIAIVVVVLTLSGREVPRTA